MSVLRWFNINARQDNIYQKGYWQWVIKEIKIFGIDLLSYTLFLWEKIKEFIIKLVDIFVLIWIKTWMYLNLFVTKGNCHLDFQNMSKGELEQIFLNEWFWKQRKHREYENLTFEIANTTTLSFTDGEFDCAVIANGRKWRTTS